jgi:hypothetical protein
MPKRIQRSRAKGWRVPTGAIYVGRPSKWGNPFPVDCYGQEGAVDRFKRWITGNMSAREMSESSRCDRWSVPGRDVSLVTVRHRVVADLHELKGKPLMCWCSLDKPCHADVLLEIANK